MYSMKAQTFIHCATACCKMAIMNLDTILMSYSFGWYHRLLRELIKHLLNTQIHHDSYSNVYRFLGQKHTSCFSVHQPNKSIRDRNVHQYQLSVHIILTHLSCANVINKFKNISLQVWLWSSSTADFLFWQKLEIKSWDIKQHEELQILHVGAKWWWWW